MKKSDHLITLKTISIFETSKELIESIIDNLGLMLFIIDRNGNIYRINRETAQIFGCSIQTVSGQNIDRFFSKKESQLICWHTQQLEKNLVKKSQIECFFERDNQTRTLLLEIKKLVSDEYISLFVISGSDITEFQHIQKNKIELEQALEFEKKLSIRFQTLAMFNEILVEDGFNHAFKTVIGKCLQLLPFDSAHYHEYDPQLDVLTESAVITKQDDKLSFIVNPTPITMDASRTSTQNRFSQVLKQYKTNWLINSDKLSENKITKTSVLFCLNFENTSFGLIEITSNQIVFEDDYLINFLNEVIAKLATFIFQINLKNQLVEKNKLLESASKMIALGEIAGGIAHEINNPLAIIYGKLEMLLKRLKSDSFDRDNTITTIQQLFKTLDRITTTIKGLKIFSKEEQSDRFSKIDLRTCISNAISICEGRIKTAHIEIRQTISGQTEVSGNENQIVHVLVHILNNAIDAIGHLPEQWIEINLTNDIDGLYLKITDSGNGISKTIANKIMQPFFTTKDPGKGTGLGLTIALGIIKAHSGALYLNTNCPNTQFVLSLPLLPFNPTGVVND